MPMFYRGGSVMACAVPDSNPCRRFLNTLPAS